MTTASSRSNEADASTASQQQHQPAARPQSQFSTLKSLFSIPTPLKTLFDQFPRKTYSANDLPARTANLLPSTDINVDSDQKHALFIWTAGAGCEDEWVASFNPTCLTWQIQLLLHRQPIQIVASNNHSCSPGSALPFLIPNPRIKGPFGLDVDPLTSSDLERRLARQRDTKPNELDRTASQTNQQQQQKIWRSLIDGPIRRAWLYHMYLTRNFDLITVPCYISSQTTHPLVRLELRRQLRSAAIEELLKHTPIIDEDAIFNEAKHALAAFESLLTSTRLVDEKSQVNRSNTSMPKDWRGLFGTANPTGVDVELFAYTFLLSGIGADRWLHGTMPDLVKKFVGLKGHRDWIAHSHLQGRLKVPIRWMEVDEASGDER